MRGSFQIIGSLSKFPLLIVFLFFINHPTLEVRCILIRSTLNLLIVQVLQYYTNLYAAMEPSPASQQAEAAILRLIPASFTERFSPEVLNQLGAPPDEPELLKALKKMAAGKSPGPDGVITEFYVKFWPILGAEFTTMIRDAITTGALPAGTNQGLMVLLPKEGDLELLTNWRPITFAQQCLQDICESNANPHPTAPP